MIKQGDIVYHDYSLHKGAVLDKRKHKLGYNYQVRFHLPEHKGTPREYRIDWYKRSVLRETARHPHPTN